LKRISFPLFLPYWRRVISNPHILPGDPFGHQGQAIAAIDLNLDLVAHRHLARLQLLGRHDGKASADSRAGGNGREKADLVETVIDAHHRILQTRDSVHRHSREHRKRQEAVCDSAAEGRCSRFFGIDVDILPVLRQIRESVDALLTDFEPPGNTDFLSRHPPQLGDGNRSALAHSTVPFCLFFAFPATTAAVAFHHA
jgi:hypothetical protein